MNRIAVLIPCYNEELTIEKVINDFKKELPEALIYVYDNNSTDNTYDIAKANGAIVRKEYNQGKGNVIRSMFKDIDADIYVMVDGDDTYPANEVSNLIKPIISDRADMVIGDRLSNGTYHKENKRGFHGFGNNLVKNLMNKIFNNHLNDIMTGYRAFSRKFVKTTAIMSNGFQIETELTVTALVHRYNVVNIPITYRDRPDGSQSKLNTFSDGFKVLLMLFDLCKGYKPLLFFGLISMILFIVGTIIGLPVIIEFIKYQYVYKVPSAILAMGIYVFALLILILGIISDHITNVDKRNHEINVNRWIEKEQERGNK